ncbi:hypothetical protein AVEN_241467-1 [Araneus ventricosus]|uniref:Uncharacterized protein n=1 Tax=Araneus ventricosus TaxID=182803 RepID=A0A4Y2SMS9_ARAVE|nr:hypothetical protein AVEN_241467-1 [Araneus ventricosus]
MIACHIYSMKAQQQLTLIGECSKSHSTRETPEFSEKRRYKRQVAKYVDLAMTPNLSPKTSPRKKNTFNLQNLKKYSNMSTKRLGVPMTRGFCSDFKADPHV